MGDTVKENFFNFTKKEKENNTTIRLVKNFDTNMKINEKIKNDCTTDLNTEINSEIKIIKHNEYDINMSNRNVKEKEGSNSLNVNDDDESFVDKEINKEPLTDSQIELNFLNDKNDKIKLEGTR
jgi:hypothetical protein